MSIENRQYALVLGASVVDIFGFCNCTYKSFDSTPGCIKMSFGGVSRNIAENMARVGVNTKFISIVGNDENGRSILEHSKVIGYDMEHSLILKNGSTPTYMAILDEKGEMVSAIADMKSIDELNEEFIDLKADIIKSSCYTFLDADNPKILEYILTNFKDETNFILDPVSAAKAEKIKHLIKCFHTIKPNRYEAEVLAGFEIKNDKDLKRAGDYFLSLGVKNVFISLDEDGIYYSNEIENGKIKADDVAVKNVTGAGDAFVAGLGYGYMNNLSITEKVKFAVAMSIIAISHEKTIHPDMSFEMVQKTIENIRWIETKY